MSEDKNFFYDITETAPYEGRKHHYIVRIGEQAKICEVFSQAGKDLILNVLNSHDELVEALAEVHAEWSQKRWDDKYINTTPGLIKAKTAIAKAKGKL